jgi:hypothetical protein
MGAAVTRATQQDRSTPYTQGGSGAPSAGTGTAGPQPPAATRSGSRCDARGDDSGGFRAGASRVALSASFGVRPRKPRRPLFRTSPTVTSCERAAGSYALCRDVLQARRAFCEPCREPARTVPLGFRPLYPNSLSTFPTFRANFLRRSPAGKLVPLIRQRGDDR